MDSFKYCDITNRQVILQHFFALQQLNQMCDLKLIVENDEINVHKIVLAAVSSYFSTLANTQFRENIDNTVKFDDIDKTTMITIIRFIYTGEIEITEDNVYNVMSVASRFQLSTLKLPISYFLISRLKTKTCMQTLAFAHLHDYEEVYCETLKFISANIAFVVGKENFYTAPAEIVKLALCQRNLQLNSILHGLEKWMCHNDKIGFSHNLTYSNFNDLEQLSNCQESNPQFSDLLKSVIKFIKRYYSDKSIIEPNKNVQMKQYQIILSIGGASQGTIHSSIESFYVGWSRSIPFFSNPSKNRSALTTTSQECISVIPAMSTPRMCFAIAQPINNPEVVFVVGGLGTSSSGWALDSCEKYDVRANSWTQLKEMPRKLKYHAAAWVDGKMVVLGGETEKGEAVDDVWEYYEKDDRWRAGTPIHIPLIGHSAVNALGSLYILGGKCGTSGLLLSTVVRYNPDLKIWTRVTDLPELKYEFGCVAINEDIFVIGGATKHFVLKSVHKYNTISNIWECCEDMPVPKSSFGCTVRNNRIYCVGGSDMVHGPLSTVEIYNPQTNRWHFSSDKLQNPRSYSCAVNVHLYNEEIETNI